MAIYKRGRGFELGMRDARAELEPGTRCLQIHLHINVLSLALKQRLGRLGNGLLSLNRKHNKIIKSERKNFSTTYEFR